MRMASVLLMTLSAVMSMQAETAENILNAMDGDTITFAYSVNGNYYLMAAESSNNIVADKVVSKENNLRALWVVKKDGTNANGFRLQNVATGQWVKIEATKKGQNTIVNYSFESSQNNSTVLYITSPSDESNYSGKGRGYANVHFIVSGNGNSGSVANYYLYCSTTYTSGEKWSAKAEKSLLRIEQWSKRDSSRVEITTNSGLTDLAFVRDNKCGTVNDQQFELLYTFQPKQITYLYNVPETSEGNSASDIVLSESKGALDNSPTFVWASNQTATSKLTADWVDNTGEIETETVDREMLVLSNSTEVNDQQWRITVTPIGNSPINLKKDGGYVDYTDNLQAKVEYNGKEYIHSQTVLRRAGHYVNTDSLYVRITPASYLFDAAPYTTAFKSQFELVSGGMWLNVDGDVLKNNGCIYADTTHIAMTQSPVSLKFACFNEDDTSADWLTAQGTGDGNFTATVTQNKNAQARHGKVSVTYEYVTQEHTFKTTIPLPITQLGTTAGDYVAFHHRPGFGNTVLDERGYQPVHTVEKTIYYAPGENVKLQLNETAFLGYYRWYDYESDKDPHFNTDGTIKQDFWVVEPTTNDGIAFQSLNSNYAYSHGRYAVGKAIGACPTIKGWDDAQTRVVACDVSAYTDYSISTQSVTEPTLSYRQLFRLRPAKEMADSLSKCTAQYYETHHYTAPIGKEVLLSTEFAHFQANNPSDKCYFYWDKTGQLQRVGNGFKQAVWYKDGAQTSMSYLTNSDYVKVSSDMESTVTYDLRLPTSVTGLDNDLLLVRFVVDYVNINTYGPSTTPLITDEEIKKNYISLIEENFNYGKPDADNANPQYFNRHLPWEEASYGYVYPEGSSPSYTRPVNGYFPYYGEYTITNKVNKNWAKGEQHGGAANGYCLYADGTTMPGLVASVTTDAKICSGQQMYFSAWVCNPCPTGVTGDLPIFRFNVQGRNQGGEWENVGQFFTGGISKGSEWYQVKFPLVSEKNYDESRVSIYDFAATASGNDFLVDDICLFASRLPLQAYQATTTCAEDSNEVILSRIDYTRLTGDWAGKLIYYQVYNTTADSGLWAKYYRYEQMHDELYPDCKYGYICIPCNVYDPAKSGDSEYLKQHNYIKEDETKLVYASVTQFIEHLVEMKEQQGRVRAQKAYIKTTEQGVERYVLYVGEIIAKNQLKATDRYEVRMAENEKDLKNPDCALQAELPMNNKSEFFFNGSVVPEQGVCANNLYPINVVVTNQYTDSNGEVQSVKANALADWLVAFGWDDCYRADSLKTKENTDKADAAFLEKYGYSRGDVWDAMREMRRVPTVSDPNPNYGINNVELLQTTSWLKDAKVDMLQDLAKKGYLKLRQETEWCYMTSEDTLRYWIFPITGTAKAVVEGEEKQLNDCGTPSFMRICVEKNDYTFSLSPIKPEDMTEQQKGQLPGARISATEAKSQFWTVVSECSENVAGLVQDSCILTGSNDPIVLEKMAQPNFRMWYSNDLDKANHKLTLTPLSGNSATMRPGYEYTLRVKLEGKNGSGSSFSDPCAVGYSYFKVIVLPDTMLWAPTVSNEWGDDRNWRGVVNGDTLDYGYAPLEGLTNVIIPTMDDPKDYPCISLNNRYPMDTHYTPNGCKDIQFRKNAILINQHLLHYKRAFVDMVLASAKWYSMAAPLQNMYSGDFFIPHSGKYTGSTWKNLESTRDFEVKPFKGTRLSDAAYAFYAAYYNRSVQLWHTETSSTNQFSSTGAVFARSNAMNEPITPGTGVQLCGYGPGNDGEELVVRLPKQDTEYYYYDKTTGAIASKKDVIGDRSKGYMLAFTPDKDAADSTMTITLRNEQESTLFLFGNPTMAYIDMELFCNDNSGIEKMFQYMDGTAWKTVTPHTGTGAFDERLIAPMQSALLTAKNSGTSLTLKLKPSHLTGLSQTVNTLLSPASADKPARAAAPATKTGWGNTIPSVMDMVLYTPLAEEENQAYATAFAAVATNSGASDDYVQGEDVLFLSSDEERGDNEVVSPLNIYTLSGNQTLMADIRREISIIPIGMVVSKEIREDYDSLYLSFRLSSTWSDECYLCDNLTHTRVPIWNDTRVKVPVPAANHELRYYIEGPAYVPAGPDIPTDNENYGNNENNESSAKVQVYTPAPQTITVVANTPIQQVRIFDITGRPLFTKSPFKGDLEGRKGDSEGLSPVLTLTVQSGIAIVETTLINGTTTRTKLFIP